ncbi:MAG: 50S ribosomal protein L22 [Candidatus Acidiferrales bacterium]
MTPETLTHGSLEGTANARFIRVSPQKARLVIDLIRGHRAAEAVQILQFTKKRIAREIGKVLHSAIANAEHKADESGESLDVDMLWVTRCFVNEGPRWKRLRTAPMGRAFRYQKRTSHIVVEVAEHARAAEDRAKAAEADRAASKGIKGAVRKARKTLEDRAKQAKKAQKKRK